jgi:hypothetical protein
MSAKEQTDKSGSVGAQQQSAKSAPQNLAGRPKQPTQLAAIIQHAQLDPKLLSSANFLQLQRTTGNRAVGQLLSGTKPLLIQAKLTVGPANDAYEQEANRVAAQVMATPTTPIAQPTDDTLQAEPLASNLSPLVQHSAEGFEASAADFENRLAAARGGGAPLPDATRRF